jgi:hypothetical protein
MKSIKFIALLTVMTLFFSLGVFAKEDSFHDSVEKLLLLMKQDQILNQTFEQIKPMAFQQFQQMNLTEEQSLLMNKYMDKIFNVMKDELSWDNIKEEFIQIYMTVYTKEEVQELITFYQSPIGRKTIEKIPQLMQQSMVISQKHMMNILPKIMEISQQMEAEMKDASKEGKNN